MNEPIPSLAAEDAPGYGGQQADANPPTPMDTGLAGLVMLARFHNIAADPDQLAHDFGESGKNLTIPQILLAAKQLGLKARQVRTDLSRLPQSMRSSALL